ncbi:MAG TPA: DUF2155 domain-containing protein [Nitrospirota bacterium]|nr:DUF2155 domain-containing protein [Nitrospirota bacterium]
MLRKIVMLAVILTIIVTFAACKKKEEQPQIMPPGHPAMEGGMPAPGMPAPGMPSMPKVERKVIVSKEVAARWKAVKLAIENKTAKTTKEYTVNIGSELSVPNTNLTVKVLAFLPDFKMTDKEFYSQSDKPNLPAAQVVVGENGKEIWNNWLFAMQPSIHPFQHEKIGILLIGGVPK